MATIGREVRSVNVLVLSWGLEMVVPTGQGVAQNGEP
jgi:hypothetical protein